MTQIKYNCSPFEVKKNRYQNVTSVELIVDLQHYRLPGMRKRLSCRRKYGINRYLFEQMIKATSVNCID